jgi:L-alanine-DL-glutamate epimerase-like enolase superfamily enzyme
MQRRSFLALMMAAPAPPLKITAVEFVRLSGRRTALDGVDRQHQVQALHVYSELRPKPYADNPNPQPREVNVSALYLKIRTDKGVEGLYGPIDREAAIVVDQQLRPFLIGKDALAGERQWDQMYRSNRHARASHFMMAISAVDNTLWDLRGRYYNTPVYRLLGGPTRERVEAYGSCLGFSVQPDAVVRKAAELRQQGFRNQKWFMAYSPSDGPEGIEKNAAIARAAREGAGQDAEVMFDAYMGWTLDYAIAWARRVEAVRPRWIEEAFPPDRIEAFTALRRAISFPVATGEHFYTRWEVHNFLKAGAISVVQADPEWCGGVSELVKICALASLYDAQVVPHGHSLHAALHVIASQSPATCPLLEYLITKMRSYYHFEKHQLTPVDGYITLPDRPGFGIEFDPAKVEKSEAWKSA